MAPYYASELWSGFTSAPNRLNNTNEIQWNKSVFEQKWPEIDEEYKVDLVCEVNKAETCIIKIMKKDLDTLTEDEAIKMALEQEEVKTSMQGRNISKIDYKMYKGCEAVVNIFTEKTLIHEHDEQQKVSEGVL